MSVGFVITLVVGPLLLAATAYIAVEAGAGRIERNRAVGIRLRSTTRSDAAWRAGHAAAVRPALIALVVLVLLDVVAGVLAATGVAPEALSIGLAGVLVIAVLVIATSASRGARAAA